MQQSLLGESMHFKQDLNEIIMSFGRGNLDQETLRKRGMDYRSID